jgi:hypothetical protein
MFFLSPSLLFHFYQSFLFRAALDDVLIINRLEKLQKKSIDDIFDY